MRDRRPLSKGTAERNETIKLELSGAWERPGSSCFVGGPAKLQSRCVLSETHLDNYPTECLGRRLKMDNKILCPSNGRKGGLLLLWNNTVNIHRIALDPMFIDVKIEEANNVVWRLTGMYGEFRWENKHMTWSRMRQLHQNHKLPWIVLGDLNEIQYLHDKDGGNPRPRTVSCTTLGL